MPHRLHRGPLGRRFRRKHAFGIKPRSLLFLILVARQTFPMSRRRSQGGLTSHLTLACGPFIFIVELSTFSPSRLRCCRLPSAVSHAHLACEWVGAGLGGMGGRRHTPARSHPAALLALPARGPPQSSVPPCGWRLPLPVCRAAPSPRCAVALAAARARGLTPSDALSLQVPLRSRPLPPPCRAAARRSCAWTRRPLRRTLPTSL